MLKYVVKIGESVQGVWSTTDEAYSQYRKLSAMGLDAKVEMQPMQGPSEKK